MGQLQRAAGHAEGCPVRSVRPVLLRGLHGYTHFHQGQRRRAHERVPCVTIISAIYTWPHSNYGSSYLSPPFLLLHSTVPQTGPPTIKFRKRTPFAVGEKLFALCNTTRGRPAPHITWLINGKKVRMRDIWNDQFSNWQFGKPHNPQFDCASTRQLLAPELSETHFQN